MAAIRSTAERFGISSETLRKRVRRAEVDDGLRPGLTTEERERLTGTGSSRSARVLPIAPSTYYGAERRPLPRGPCGTRS